MAFLPFEGRDHDAPRFDSWREDMDTPIYDNLRELHQYMCGDCHSEGWPFAWFLCYGPADCT